MGKFLVRSRLKLANSLLAKKQGSIRSLGDFLKSKLYVSLGFFGLLLLLPSMLRANTCSTTTLASLGTNGGCTIGDKQFSNFILSNLGGTTVAASEVSVNPIGSEPFGFTFTLETPSSPGTTFLVINFQVSNLSSLNTIEDLEINTTGFSGTNVGAVENACIGAGNLFTGLEVNNIPGCTLTTQAVPLRTGFGNPSSASFSFSPVSAVDLSTGFIIDNGTPITITEQISQTPEPSNVLLFGTGLLALAAMALRKKQLA